MPSKIQLDENLWFLYICLQKSDYKAIDFNAVGDATQLKPPAARMRYTRLRRAIESGTLIGTNGAPFQGATDKETGHQKRRKKPLLSARSEGTADLGPMQTRSGNSFERGPKLEEVSANEFAADGTSEEDELPLAKKRTKLSSHSESPPKNEVYTSKRSSPVLSHTPTAEDGLPCNEEMELRPTEHPCFATSSNVDQASFNMETPKPDLGNTPASFSKYEPRDSGEDPRVGDSTSAPVSVDYLQALCEAEDKYPSHTDRKPSLDLRVNKKGAPFEQHTEVHHSGQPFKHEIDEPGPTPKVEKLPAEQKITFELSDAKSPPSRDDFFATCLLSHLRSKYVPEQGRMDA
ncbi:MAG: hypothetical protein FRX48_06896 [Lasallia pustulata]|uniref:Myb-like DNA-binding domain-containing protein n=1 Tax=Lasallia pustulata TaxID=136370 RepID=A0A5M8PIV4_9LECA|nr:MAG: hypothetical protein FRX48_06896 [Lasallia pustulata]